MTIKEILKNSQTVLFMRIVHEKLLEVPLLAKYIANGNRMGDKDKLLTDLTIRAHAIEKGMSIGNVKIGFGQQKVIALLNDLNRYLGLGGAKEFVAETCSIIIKYLIFNEELGADMSKVRMAYRNFMSSNGIIGSACSGGGILRLRLSEEQTKAKLSFGEFSQSRHSIRDFGEKPVNEQLIREALKLCEHTPSACNRQSWKIYIFKDKEKRQELFNLQLGCNGFSEDMQYAILICGDIRGYNINELYQLYVDGGIYSMNLLYALHYLGVAAIPLTMAHKKSRTKLIKKRLDIPENEMPVLLIGVGSYKEQYKVAVSERKSFEEYCNFI